MGRVILYLSGIRLDNNFWQGTIEYPENSLAVRPGRYRSRFRIRVAEAATDLTVITMAKASNLHNPKQKDLIVETTCALR
jgi:hypothetical protein